MKHQSNVMQASITYIGVNEKEEKEETNEELSDSDNSDN